MDLLHCFTEGLGRDRSNACFCHLKMLRNMGLLKGLSIGVIDTTPPNNPFFPTPPFWTPTFFHRKKTTKTTKKPTLFGQTLHFLLQVCYNEFQLQTAAAFTPQTLFGLLGAAGEARLTWKVPLPMKLCLETKRSEGIHDVKMEVS